MPRFDVNISVVDEQNRHTQVQRMSSSSSIKRENSEELKDAEPRKFVFLKTSTSAFGQKRLSLKNNSES